MFNDVFKTVFGLFICGLILFGMVQNREAIYSALGLVPNTQTVAQPQTASVIRPAEKVKSKSSGGRVTLQKNPRDGQFWTDAKINNRNITLLVDTGASMVALTLDDAKRAGVKPRSLEYNVPVSTAGGQVMAARTRLKSIKVGSIRVKDVQAVVIPEGLHVSLLGMTYLGQVKKIEVSPTEMTLKN